MNSFYHSPTGWLEVSTTDTALTGLNFTDTPVESLPTPTGYATEVWRQLEEYFAGKRTSFQLELALEGTPFQLKVWQALQTIPFGETYSYLDLAQAIGQPKAMRAVGGANGRNPIVVVVPCHRVIAHDGSLGGFSAGLDRKRWLLQHEGL